MRGVVSRVSQRIGILRMVNGVYSMLTPLCCFADITPSSSLSLNIVLLSGGLRPAVTFGFLIVIHSLGSVLIRILSLLITAAALLGCVCCTKFTAIRNTVYMVSCLRPVRGYIRHTRAAAVAHPCELEVPRCRTSQFGRRFLPAHVRMCNDLPSSVFDSGTLSGFKGAANLSLLP